jgi:hypothetical protein
MFVEREQKAVIIIPGKENDTSRKDCKVISVYKDCEICKKGDELILHLTARIDLMDPPPQDDVTLLIVDVDRD